MISNSRLRVVAGKKLWNEAISDTRRNNHMFQDLKIYVWSVICIVQVMASVDATFQG